MKFPSTVLTVIVAVPALTPSTAPVPETVATLPLSLTQFPALFDALLGKNVGVNLTLAPLAIRTVEGKVALTSGVVTVTVKKVLFPPSWVLTRIIVTPLPTAVINPLLFTVATFG